MKNNLIIVAAPSGAGKSSFVEKICKENSFLVDTITYTTRAPRAGESQGKPYYFISKDDFQRKVAEGFFVEWAQVHTNYYGTPLDQLETAWAQNKWIIMDVDVQGFRTFKAKYPQAKSIFILPPSIDELRRRIVKRDGKVPEDMEIRLKNAEKEISEAEKFERRLVNDKFDVSYKEFKKIIEEWIASS